jgi:hypothetical protein
LPTRETPRGQGVFEESFDAKQDNHPMELYGYETLKQKLNYRHNNPIRAGIVYESWYYKYSSAIDYCITMKVK